MKTIWIVLTLVFGALVFVLGCMMGGDTMQYVGAGFLFVGEGASLTCGRGVL